MKSAIFALQVFASVFALGKAHASEQIQSQERLPASKTEAPVARDYCSSFVDAAMERRLTRLKEQLQSSRDEVTGKIEELKTRSDELRKLLEERKAVQNAVTESLLKIYRQVEPESAALQLSKLEPATAAEILVKLDAKKSGEILTLMDPKQAASLVALLTLQTNFGKDANP